LDKNGGNERCWRLVVRPSGTGATAPELDGVESTDSANPFEPNALGLEFLARNSDTEQIAGVELLASIGGGDVARHLRQVVEGPPRRSQRVRYSALFAMQELAEEVDAVWLKRVAEDPNQSVPFRGLALQVLGATRSEVACATLVEAANASGTFTVGRLSEIALLQLGPFRGPLVNSCIQGVLEGNTDPDLMRGACVAAARRRSQPIHDLLLRIVLDARYDQDVVEAAADALATQRGNRDSVERIIEVVLNADLALTVRQLLLPRLVIGGVPSARKALADLASDPDDALRLDAGRALIAMKERQGAPLRFPVVSPSPLAEIQRERALGPDLTLAS
jgi:HEAT repeat protein